MLFPDGTSERQLVHNGEFELKSPLFQKGFKSPTPQIFVQTPLFGFKAKIIRWSVSQF
jgi:hypothetical protein